jgi:hypothetical protein
VFGSEEAMPFSCAVAPDATVNGAPAFARGARITGVTVTVTAAVALRLAGVAVLVTVRLNMRLVIAATGGAVKVGVAVLVPVRVTTGSPGLTVCTQLKVSGRGGVFGSVEAVPASCTVDLAAALAGPAAFAMGGRKGTTVTVTVAVALFAGAAVLVTVRTKVRLVAAATAGAVKVGEAVAGPERVTAGPAVCVQA